MEKRFAILIDAENISAKYITYILDEMAKYGSITYKRIYGDWTKDDHGSWKKVLLDNSILPVQQYSYTRGKNTTDSAMIIDAMDILYTHTVDGFCLISSDSDFTRLAQRLRESGMMVIGMGEQKTPKPFCAACNVFKYIDILTDANNKMAIENKVNEEGKKEHKSMTELSVIYESILAIIEDKGTDEQEMDMGELGSRLIKRYPDFDVRNYGYTKFSKFLQSCEKLSIKKNNSQFTVALNTESVDLAKIEKMVIGLINDSKSPRINMGTLSQRLLNIYPKFNVKYYGYTKFSKLLEDMPTLEIQDGGNQRGRTKFVRVKKKEAIGSQHALVTNQKKR